VSVIEIHTPHGPARARVHAVPDARGVLVLGHGAGGGIGAPDLQASTAVALGLGLAVVLVEQPYRVAGRRSPAPARQLDAAWLAVIADLRSRRRGGLGKALGAPTVARDGQAGAGEPPLIVGGRSSGARVACRTAADAQAAGVLCLAFPVHPPGKADDPAKSRISELDAVAVPVLVVQGERDPFGRPPEGPDRAVVVVPGDHALRNRAAVSAAIEPWLMTLSAASRV
jgi:predicted alpha/beta-hydrolase family hydrolase